MNDEFMVDELVMAAMIEAYNVLEEARRWLTEDIPPVDDVVEGIDAALSKLRAHLDGDEVRCLHPPDEPCELLNYAPERPLSGPTA